MAFIDDVSTVSSHLKQHNVPSLHWVEMPEGTLMRQDLFNIMGAFAMEDIMDCPNVMSKSPVVHIGIWTRIWRRHIRT